jgi:Zn-dependent protease
MHPYRGLELGRPLGFPLLLHGSWLPAGALVIAHLSFTAYGDRDLAPSIAHAAITVAAFFVCVALHGLAHVVSARMSDAPREPVRLFVFGDVHPGAHDRGAARTALAGPAVSAAIGGLLVLLGSSFSGTVLDIVRTLAAANLTLAAVNLVPGLPFDGGRLLVAVSRKDRRTLAMRIGVLSGFIAVIGGVWLLLGGRGILADTALGLWFLLAGIFVVAEARSARGRASGSLRIKDLTVGSWARPFVGRIDASSAVPAGEGPFAVSEDGRLAGVLTRTIPRPGKRVGDVMIPWTADLGVSADAPLSTALERLATASTPVVVVVDREGVVRGVLDEYAVRERLARR